MDIDQHIAQGAQLYQGCVIPVNESLAATIGMEHATDDTLAIGDHFVFQQPAVGRVQVVQAETYRDLGALRTATDTVCFGAVARGQFDGIEKNGFTGPGFPGERAHTVFELEL